VTLGATASSGLATVFRVISGPATVSGSTLTITGVGTVVVAADQAGDGSWQAAPEVTQSITVAPMAGTTQAASSSGGGGGKCGLGSAFVGLLGLAQLAILRQRRRR
jgi:hypothetical protein